MLTREDIKTWLKGPTGMRRTQLAELCGVSLSCVNNWLAESKTNPIPYAKLQLIERIIAENEPKQTDSTPVNPEEITAIAVMMSKEQRIYLTEAARRLGQTLDEFILNATIEHSERILGKFDQQNSNAG